MKNIFYGILFVVFWSFLSFSINFSGSYKMISGNTQLFLVLQQKGTSLSGGLTGTTGADFKLQGNVEGEYAAGKCFGNNLQVFFNLYFEGNELYVQLIEPDANGQPDWTKLRELVFKKSGGSLPVSPKQTYTPQRKSNIASNPLAKSSGSLFNGKYSGDGLKLNLKRAGQSVTGSMEFGGSNFRIKGNVSGNNLAGTFSSSAGTFNFTASENGKNMKFVTAGTTYRLKGKTTSSNPLAKKSNPLARGGSRQSANSASASASSSYTKQPTSASNSNGRIKVDSMGLSFVPPRGWICKKDSKSGNYIMGSNDIAGLIFILPHSYNSVQELINGSSQGFTDEGVQLNLSGQVERLSNNSVGAEFSGVYQGAQAKSYVVGVVSPNGGGLLGLCITTAEKYTSQHRTSAVELAKSVRFYKPKVDTALMNALAYNYYSYSGSTERKLSLCSNGVYYDSSESSYSGNFSDSGGNNTGAWGTAGADSGSGRWKAVGTTSSGTIYFIHRDGSESEARYSATNDAFYLNGIKYGYNGRATCR